MRPTIGIPCILYTGHETLDRPASWTTQTYVRALEMAGGAPLLIPIITQEETLQTLYQRIDGLLLAGGGDVDPAHFGEARHPDLGNIETERDWVELTITPWALADGMPVVGICRGIQTLNVAAGGSLWQDITAQVPQASVHRRSPDYPAGHLSHAVQLEPGSRLAEVLGVTEQIVNSGHHQAVRDVGDGLRVTARALDGIIEGIESVNDAWVVGVQWHPERLLDDVPRMRCLFESFVAACEACRATRGKRAK